MKANHIFCYFYHLALYFHNSAPSANAAVKETDRLTGAAKKNKDQQRHGAKPRNAKKADAPVTEVSDGKKPKREFDRNSSDPKTKKVS